MEKILRPVTGNWIITQTFAEHLEWAAAHPDVLYNGGLDLYSGERTIRAAAAGTVRKIGFDASGYGNYIVLSHDGFETLYAHLLKAPVLAAGDQVKAGEEIGIMGTTGKSTGVHLHFEVRVNGEPIDPESVIAEDQTAEEFAAGDQCQVACDYGANLRTKPSADYADVVARMPKGTLVTITGAAQDFGGLRWRPIRRILDGYVAEFDGDGTKLITKVKEG